MYIQGDSSSMLTPIFPSNIEFIKILNFGIFKYTQSPYFQIYELFVLHEECLIGSDQRCARTYGWEGCWSEIFFKQNIR